MADFSPLITPTTDWDFIIDTIRRKKCVLFLGPEAFANDEGVRMDRALSKFLGAKSEKHPYIKNYYEEDGFYLFRDENFRPRVIVQMRKFFEEFSPQPTGLFEKIALIPFNVVLSLNPDNFLSNIYRLNNIPHQFSYYHKNKPAKSLSKPISELPIIYNLLGALEDYESLILTNNDFFSYLSSIFKGKSMSIELKDELHDAQNYIFLGLPFKRWYIPILLRVLALHVDNAFFARLSPASSIPDETISFYSEQFKIEFIPYDIQSFVDELYSRCEKEGILRQPPQKKIVEIDEDFSPDKIIEFIAFGYTEKALDKFKLFLEAKGQVGDEAYSSLIVLMNRYRKTSQDELNNLIDRESAALDYARINHSLVSLVTKAKNF